MSKVGESMVPHTTPARLRHFIRNLIFIFQDCQEDILQYLVILWIEYYNISS